MMWLDRRSGASLWYLTHVAKVVVVGAWSTCHGNISTWTSLHDRL